jgi:hypothetical protein
VTFVAATSSRVGAQGAGVAEPFEFTLLQHTEQLGLQFERRLADFVEKDRPAMGQLESPDPLRDRAGKRALFVAKQLAFEQAGGDGGAVALHEGVPASRTQGVEGASDQLLPRAGLTTDEHRRSATNQSFAAATHRDDDLGLLGNDRRQFASRVSAKLGRGASPAPTGGRQKHRRLRILPLPVFEEVHRQHGAAMLKPS